MRRAALFRGDEVSRGCGLTATEQPRREQARSAAEVTELYREGAT